MTESIVQQVIHLERQALLMEEDAQRLLKAGEITELYARMIRGEVDRLRAKAAALEESLHE